MKNNLMIITFMALCAPVLLFAPKGGGGVDRDCHMTCEYRGGSIGNCSDMSCSYGDAGQREANSHGGGASSSAGGSSYNDSAAVPAMSAGALTQASQAAEGSILAECYINNQGRICTKAQVMAANAELASVVVDALKDKYPVGIFARQILAPFFGEDPVDLDCGLARRASIEQCRAAAAKIKQEIDAKRHALAQPAYLSHGTLSTATNIPGAGFYELQPTERAALIKQFGAVRWAVRAIELASGRCAYPNKMHFCYGANRNSPHLIAKYDAMTQEQLDVWGNGVIALIRAERARGAC
jgi:hypothetical protein